MAITKGTEIATIDVALVTIETTGETPTTLAVNTASQIQVAVDMETTEAVKLIIKGKLKAQKGQENTITGHTITLTDNVFIPQLAKVLQGGTIEYDVDGTTFKKYTPPVVGSSDKGEVFKLTAYSTQYGTDGLIMGYEKIVYPNCQGTPFGITSQDNTFRVPQYTINSKPSGGEAPYTLEIVSTLPVIS